LLLDFNLPSNKGLEGLVTFGLVILYGGAAKGRGAVTDPAGIELASALALAIDVFRKVDGSRSRTQQSRVQAPSDNVEIRRMKPGIHDGFF